MKNIHVLPTDKPSRFSLNSSGKYHLTNQLHTNSTNFTNRNIYITNDETIKEGDWVIVNKKYIRKVDITFNKQDSDWNVLNTNKIILTTDPTLIADGVQAIDDTFLQWFVAHPSCEFVEVGYGWIRLTETNNEGYWVSIPDNQYEMTQEEPKQETLEEREPYWDLIDKKAEQNNRIDLDAYANGVQDGVKWQKERSYSEEDMFKFSQWISHEDWVYLPSKDYWVNEEQEELEQKLSSKEILNLWFEQFKKK